MGIANKENEVIGAMMWYSDLVPTDQLDKDNVSLTLYDFKVEDLVYVEPITGYVHDLKPLLSRGAVDGGKIRFGGLPLWDSPILLMKKSVLKLK